MSLDRIGLAARQGLNHSPGDARAQALEIVCRRYVREKQHVMRLRQHAERIVYEDIRRVLLGIAAQDAVHLRAIEEIIVNLGGKLPAVIDFYCSRDNSWEYLRSDLDEERRCIAEMAEDILRVENEFPEIAALLQGIEADAKKHREEIRALLSNENRRLWAA